MKIILIADNDKCLQWSLSTWLRFCGEDFLVMTADTGREALSLLAAFHPDLVITTLRMPGLDEKEYLNKVAASCIKTPIIAMTPYIDEEISERLRLLGASDHVMKPFKFEVMLEKIHFCCFRRMKENAFAGSEQ
jgi:CheY-like chemotaxis protein